MWVVIGGRAPGVFADRPPISCGYRSPSFPIAIHTDDKRTADTVFSCLQPIATDFETSTFPILAARAFYESATVRALLSGQVSGFYCVLVGYESGIFLTWRLCQASVTRVPKAVYKKLANMADAMEWMITKAHRTGNATNQLCRQSTPLVQIQAQLSSPRVEFDLADFPTSFHLRTTTTQPAHRLGNQPSIQPVYQHIREISGIRGSVSEPVFDDTPLPSFGELADHYLQTHGYSVQAILTIAHVLDTTATCMDFVNAISSHGMPVMEVYFLWALINIGQGTTVTT